MSFLIDNQLVLIFGAFVLGILGATLAFRLGRRSFWVPVADLIWVGLGGLGALAAILSGIYQDDRTRLERQIDIAYGIARVFEADAGRFRLAYCDQGPAYAFATTEVRVLCDRVEFLHASTAQTRRLPLFLEATQTVQPLRALRVVLGGPDLDETRENHARVADFDPGELLSFAARTPATDAALDNLARRPLTVGITAEYRVIAGTYEDLIATSGRLVAEWRFLEGHSLVLTLQVIALSLIAFAAPFRLGKSLSDLG